ncbi:MAG: hypothetical protein C5B50_24465 [Verrucomicrobia bacterium]|nr:MAG: hypothetical protein C5B50_24465 [Verrucomicrobiota bacterium]
MQVSRADGVSEQKPTAAPISEAPVQTVTLYHWLVVILASCGWLFDCFGQRVFVLSREPAIRELLGVGASDASVAKWMGSATAALMIGWGTGGILFGMVSDRYGRVKAMLITLVTYTIFSGLAGFARSVGEFLVLRFLFGVGVGGMFGAATTLIAESVPRRFRTSALGAMQALSATGNILASALSLQIIPGQDNFWGHFSGWQVLSFASVVPLLLAVPVALILREPESWRKAKATMAQGGKAVGSMADLFRHPIWRRNAFVGIGLGLAGMVGLWGIGFFSPELIRTAFRDRPLQTEEIVKPDELFSAIAVPANPAVARLKSFLSPDFLNSLSPQSTFHSPQSPTIAAVVADLNRVMQRDDLYDETAFSGITLKKSTTNLLSARKSGGHVNVRWLNRQLLEQLFPGTIRGLQPTIDHTISFGTMIQDAGSVLGMLAFTFVASRFSRRTAFLAAFIFCLGAVSYVFYSLKTSSDVYWMLPLLGFATLSCFAGYSIYFPELFPTRLRGTGVGLCYNTVRYLAAGSPYLLGWLNAYWPFRTVAVAMSSIYLVGILALLWAPETKGKPLPED